MEFGGSPNAYEFVEGLKKWERFNHDDA